MKNELPYCKTSEGIIGYSESIIAKGETNDCVVRAFASCFDLQYDKAHKFVKEKFNRVDRQGTFRTVYKMTEIATKGQQINYKKVKCLGNKTKLSNQLTLKYKVKTKEGFVMRNMTVGMFTKQNHIGTFFILVDRHAFTIKNGVIIGNMEDAKKPKRVVRHAFEIK
jgi:hypothetical protein